MDTPSTNIGPGFGAFLAFFALALALWFLMRNMNGRMRRMAYREQERVAAAEPGARPRPAAPAGAADPAEGAPGAPAGTAEAADGSDPADGATDTGGQRGRDVQ